MKTTTDNETQIVFEGRRHKRAAFGAGLLAGATFTLAMLVLYWLNLTSRTLANLVADKVSSLLPGNFTEIFIQSIGPLGKQLEFFSVLLGQIIVGGLFGLLMVTIWPRIVGVGKLYRNAFILLGVIWLVMMTAGLALLDQGFFGSMLGNAQLPILVSTYLLFALFAAALGYFFVRLVPAFQSDTVAGDDGSLQLVRTEKLVVGNSTSRRTFVTALGGFFVLVGGGALTTAVLKSVGKSDKLTFGEIGDSGTTTPVPVGTPGTSDVAPITVSGEVTDNATFYHVSKNAVDPTNVSAGWVLKIDGLVNTPQTLGIGDIRALPPVTTYHTLTCISNPVAGPYIGTAKWKGARLRDILAKAGVKPEGKRLVFTCADGYTDSITVAKAMETETIAAYEMNDVTLPDDHGAPVRMLIPNIYGMKNAKWVQSMTIVADADYKGFWEKQGWDNEATIHTVSAIVAPTDVANYRFMVGQEVALRGYAYAGNRGIERVEVSADGGQTWNAAKKKAPISGNAWTLWQYNWTPQAAQEYVLKVRAFDGTGTPQSTQVAETFPAGASGLQSVTVRAVKVA